MPWTLPRLRASRRRHRNRAQTATRKAKHFRRIGIRQRAIVRKRTRQIQLAKRQRAIGKGAEAAVKWALAQVGTAESPWGSNRGPKISDWNKRSVGVDGIPWCQSFANAVLVAGGGPQLKSAYTPQVVQWARERKYGLSLVPVSQRRPGDFVYFKWPGVSHDFCDHVGVDVAHDDTTEGNTSPGNSGSQNNGGQVAVRSRGNAYVVAVVRPTYG